MTEEQEEKILKLIEHIEKKHDKAIKEKKPDKILLSLGVLKGIVWALTVFNGGTIETEEL